MSHEPLLVGLLAAGSGSRMRHDAVADKLLVDVHGRELLQWSIDVTRHAIGRDANHEIVVIVGSDDTRRRASAEHRNVQVITAPHATRGVRWSIHALLQEAVTRRHGVIILLADDPLAAFALPYVTNHARKHRDSIIAIDRPEAAPHPVLLPYHVVDELARSEPAGNDDRGLASLLKSRDVSWLPAPADLPYPTDVDELDDLPAITAALATFHDLPSA